MKGYYGMVSRRSHITDTLFFKNCCGVHVKKLNLCVSLTVCEQQEVDKHPVSSLWTADLFSQHTGAELSEPELPPVSQLYVSWRDFNKVLSIYWHINRSVEGWSVLWPYSNKVTGSIPDNLSLCIFRWFPPQSKRSVVHTNLTVAVNESVNVFFLCEWPSGAVENPPWPWKRFKSRVWGSWMTDASVLDVNDHIMWSLPVLLSTDRKSALSSWRWLKII